MGVVNHDRAVGDDRARAVFACDGARRYAETDSDVTPARKILADNCWTPVDGESVQAGPPPRSAPASGLVVRSRVTPQPSPERRLNTAVKSLNEIPRSQELRRVPDAMDGHGSIRQAACVTQRTESQCTSYRALSLRIRHFLKRIPCNRPFRVFAYRRTIVLFGGQLFS